MNSSMTVNLKVLSDIGVSLVLITLKTKKL